MRLAEDSDIPQLVELIPLSARGLQAEHYSAAQIEAALGSIFAVDRQLIRDRTYFVVERDGVLVGCGGWSRRLSMYDGRDSAEDRLLDPATEPARIRAFFVHPAFARQGIGRAIMEECEREIAAAGFRSIEIAATRTGEMLYRNFGYAVADRSEIDLSGGLLLPICRMLKQMTSIETERVRKWVEQAVLGLGLCPFAGEPWHSGRVRLVVTDAASDRALVEDLRAEIARLDETDPKLLETTLLIVPNLLQDFEDYNQFLDLADSLIHEHRWAGRFQIASFHPDYQFAGTKPDDVENLTNRAPYPLLHVLRERSVSRAQAEHPNSDQIPEANIATLRALSDERRQEIFGFLRRS